MEGWLAPVLVLIGSVSASAVALWLGLLNKRQARELSAAEVELNEAQSVDTLSGRAIDLTMKVIELGERVSILTGSNEMLRERVVELESKVEEMGHANRELATTNRALVAEIHSLRNQLRNNADPST